MIKGYFVWQGQNQWLDCYLILEDAFCPASHICSHPSFAPGDLYFSRPERIEILKRMYPEGIDWQPLVRAADLPADFLARIKVGNDARIEEWNRIKAELKCKDET